MKKLFATAAVLAAVGTGLATTSVVQAEDARPAPQAPAQSDHGMMGGDMSGMMSRMNKMMDTCEKMMQSKDQRDRKGNRG